MPANMQTEHTRRGERQECRDPTRYNKIQQHNMCARCLCRSSVPGTKAQTSAQPLDSVSTHNGNLPQAANRADDQPTGTNACQPGVHEAHRPPMPAGAGIMLQSNKTRSTCGRQAHAWRFSQAGRRLVRALWQDTTKKSPRPSTSVSSKQRWPQPKANSLG